ncbi:MAG: ethanolamine ammonia-lyase subunit EutC [Xanthobacteraceae bacterium]
MTDTKEPVPARDKEIWTELRKLTAARIGLARSGAALSTMPLLDFRLAHVRARDAVYETLDEARLVAGLKNFGLPVVSVSSAAPDRKSYLMQPDLGRALGRTPPTDTEAIFGPYQGRHYDVAFVIADGLSACAVPAHAQPLLAEVLPALRTEHLLIAPLVVAQQGRVAIGDAIASALHADVVVVLIGERPGLSAPDSMGAYLTWQPHPQTTDADRNCISNIRPEGVGYADAAFRLAYLLRAMRSRRLSGVRLKDDSDRLLIGGQPADS